MIIINGKNFDNALKKVSFGEYNVTQDGKKRNGSAPFISFKFDNVILLFILTTPFINNFLGLIIAPMYYYS